jgi:hypothetical protein
VVGLFNQPYISVSNTAPKTRFYDFTDSEIDILQKQMDKWTRVWIKLNNKEGITNYMHMLESKHVTYFLKRYRNLYRYSNQGWEFQNKQVSKHKAILFE